MMSISNTHLLLQGSHFVTQLLQYERVSDKLVCEGMPQTNGNTSDRSSTGPFLFQFEIAQLVCPVSVQTVVSNGLKTRREQRKKRSGLFVLFLVIRVCNLRTTIGQIRLPWGRNELSIARQLLCEWLVG